LIQSGDVRATDIKLIGGQHRPDFPFMTSTRLYPEWPFAAMPNVDNDLARQVAALLLAIPHEGELAKQMQIAGFTIPGDYRAIDELMRQLRLPPFDQPLDFTFDDVFERWSYQVVVLVVAVFLILTLLLILLVWRNRALQNANDEIAHSNQQIRQLSQAVEQSPEAILITDAFGRIEYMNPSFEKITGYCLKDLQGLNPRILSAGVTHLETYAYMWKQLLAGQTWRGELVNRRKSGEVYPAETLISPVYNSQNRLTHYLAIQKDITRRKRDQDQIRSLLYFDPLTGLANRNQLIEKMDQALSMPNGLELIGCVILINVDHFKLINEVRGVEMGDSLLVHLGERLKDWIGNNGLVAHLVADEFGLLCKNDRVLQDQQVWMQELAQELIAKLSAPFSIEGERFSIDVSIGLAALWQSDEPTVEVIQRVMAQASTALKHAKRNGGNRFELFSPRMTEEVIQRHQVEKTLRQAIYSGHLQLFLQPQFDQSEQWVGAEALVRWFDPAKGLIPPSEFIEIAEKSDLIIELSRWVIHRACEVLAQARDMNLNLTLSINISPRHFRQMDFEQDLMSSVEFYQVQPSQVILEITEGLFLDNVHEVIEKMHALQDQGFRFSIDDFGTGYSSLSYLRQLPVNEIKIDRSFVQSMEKEGLQGSLVDMIISVARRLNLKVVVEGVETRRQMELLLDFSELVFQGYLFGRPEPAHIWLARWENNNNKQN